MLFWGVLESSTQIVRFFPFLGTKLQDTLIFIKGQMIDLSDYEPSAIAMADLNADSSLDVAVVANDPKVDESFLLVALNQGNGQFAAQPTKFTTGVATNDLAIAFDRFAKRIDRFAAWRKAGKIERRAAQPLCRRRRR